MSWWQRYSARSRRRPSKSSSSRCRPADQWDTRTYRAIWAEFGERIVAAFETVTCLPFAESRVPAIVADDVSHSGGPEHPMQLRATYARAVKQATLVHELGHRHLWQLAERLDGIDGHMTLYLVLDGCGRGVG